MYEPTEQLFGRHAAMHLATDVAKNTSGIPTKQAMEKSLSATKEVMEASLHKCGTRVAVGIVIAVLVLIVQGIVWYSWVQMAQSSIDGVAR